MFMYIYICKRIDIGVSYVYISNNFPFLVHKPFV